MGPSNSETQLETVMKYVKIGQDGRREAGDAAAIGSTPARTRRASSTSRRSSPTSTPKMRIAREEIFGPVVSVIPCESLDEAIAIGNGVEYGLSASIYTQDINRAFQAMRDLYTGIFYVNAPTIGAEVHLPFGGTKNTGNGHREAGVAALDVFSEWKSVYIDFSGKLQRAQIDVERRSRRSRCARGRDTSTGGHTTPPPRDPYETWGSGSSTSPSIRRERAARRASAGADGVGQLPPACRSRPASAAWCSVRRREWEGTQRMSGTPSPPAWRSGASARWAARSAASPALGPGCSGTRCSAWAAGSGPVVGLLARPIWGPASRRRGRVGRRSRQLRDAARDSCSPISSWCRASSRRPGPRHRPRCSRWCRSSGCCPVPRLRRRLWLARQSAWRDTFVRLALGASVGFFLRLLTSGAISSDRYHEGSVYDLAWIVPFMCYVWAGARGAGVRRRRRSGGRARRLAGAPSFRPRPCC